MSAQRDEKIGIIVVHGVGATEAGWIDTYFVPELEKWRAYENVGGSGRKDGTNDLLIEIDTKDGRLALALGDDDDFKSFCTVTGLENLLTEPDPRTGAKAFVTRKDRARLRDRLMSRIAPVMRSRTAIEWVALLNGHNVPAAVAFNAESEVYRVRDPKSSRPTNTWSSFTRRWPINGREVQVSELYWADLSRVGNTSLTRFSALVQLFLESPYVLGTAFLDGSNRGIHKLINFFVAAANWVMRWPIAGLNVAVFFTAFMVMALQELGRMDFLVEVVAASLIAVVIGGYKTFRDWEHRKVGLSSLSLASSITAALLLALLAAGVMGAPAAKLRSADNYLIISMWLILLAWAVWTLLIIAAVALVTLVAIKRVFIRASPGSPPVARASAAISLSLLLGMIWKFVLSILGILVIRSLAAGGAPPSESCPAGTSLRAFTLANAPTDCQLSFMKALLVDISALNTAALAGVTLAVLAVIFVRRAALSLFKARAAEGSLWLPRLIANPFIVAAIFAGALINAAVFYIPAVADMHIPKLLRDTLRQLPIDELGTGALGLVVFYFLIMRVVEMSDGFVHIGRDLVDHQYNPNPRSLESRLGAKDGTAAGQTASPRPTGFRRRRRIQARLEALIHDVIVGKQFDRLIFFGHSQGTVIIHDYLFNHGGFVRPEHYELLKDIKQIDVLTIGSPLTHIYRYYFHDYDRAPGEPEFAAPLLGKIKSWTNMWRVDDPIGQNVDYLDSIANVGLAPGGHTYYWRENPVCAKLWSVIHDEHPANDAMRNAKAAE